MPCFMGSVISRQAVEKSRPRGHTESLPAFIIVGLRPGCGDAREAGTISMKDIASWILNTAQSRGAGYCDLRVVDERARTIATKNGKVGHASNSESLGVGIRVIADGAWGFAATQDLSRTAVEATAARAVEVARASARVKQHELQLAPEKAYVDEWTTPYKIDPFTTSIADNIDLLLKVDS